MTKDKAIEEVKNYDNYPNGLSKECRDYIIKALEQEPFKPMVEIDLYSVIKQKYIEREVLDKIRAEIKHFMYDVNPSSSESDYACNYILQIIDKYKAEKDQK